MDDIPWGSVEGDHDARSIFADRREGLHGLAYLFWGCLAGLIFSAVWFWLTGDRAALALEIVSAALTVTFAVTNDIHNTHTYLLITETRVRSVEERVQRMDREGIAFKSSV